MTGLSALPLEGYWLWPWSMVSVYRDETHDFFIFRMLSIILLLTGLINFRIVMYCGNITHMYIHVLLSVVKAIVKKTQSCFNDLFRRKLCTCTHMQ